MTRIITHNDDNCFKSFEAVIAGRHGILGQMFLSIWTPDPILFSAGTITIYWYGVCLALGAGAGLLVIVAIGRSYKFSRTFLTDLFVMLVVGGFIGGRIYHVLNEWGYYAAQPAEIFRVWNGGLAIHGAMLVGLLILVFTARRQRIDAWRLADVMVVGLAIGQAVGRWGNYFNQELFGGPTSLPWKILIDSAHRPPGFETTAYFHPTFLYESVGCLLIAAGLWLLHQATSRRTIPGWAHLWIQPGFIALTYFILYSILRIGMESLRIDQVPLIGGIRLPLISSVLIIIISVVIALFRRRQLHAKA